LPTWRLFSSWGKPLNESSLRDQEPHVVAYRYIIEANTSVKP
jgi:hypothetical protein